MIYDYIIIGSGISGNVLAYLLSESGKKCLILEKDAIRKEKTCGGGIPHKAILKLTDIGFDIASLLSKDVSIIKGDCVFYGVEKEVSIYKESEWALGSQRCIFDEFLLNQAMKQGAVIRRGEYVSKIRKVSDRYDVNGYFGREIVIACGARGLDGRCVKGQSYGISAQIIGKSKLNSNLFYFWYYELIKDKYFWCFPIGNDIWNVGIWFMKPTKHIKSEFKICWKSIVDKYFQSGYKYLRKPKGEFCGNIDLRAKFDYTYNGVGDFSGSNNIKNGGGIYKGIMSSIEFFNKVEFK